MKPALYRPKDFHLGSAGLVVRDRRSPSSASSLQDVAILKIARRRSSVRASSATLSHSAQAPVLVVGRAAGSVQACEGPAVRGAYCRMDGKLRCGVVNRPVCKHSWRLASPRGWHCIGRTHGCARRARLVVRNSAEHKHRPARSRCALAAEPRQPTGTSLRQARWRTSALVILQEFGGLKSDQIRRLKDLETENTRLRRAVSDLTLDKLILQEAARGNY